MSCLYKYSESYFNACAHDEAIRTGAIQTRNGFLTARERMQRKRVCEKEVLRLIFLFLLA